MENSPPTVNEVVEAIKKNGWPKTKRAFFRTSKGIGISTFVPKDIQSACAMGQASLNLNMSTDTVSQVLDHKHLRASELTSHEQNIVRSHYRASFGTSDYDDVIPAGILVTMLNDHTEMTVQQIGERLEELVGSPVG